ncbi:MAG TPA: hypothetical protein VG796_23980 [Verrucomicrobiales bacterium]|nr:hypothetical protein [Verrucomicrobiales bacterium]
MDKTVSLNGLMVALAQLRGNALLALETSGGSAVSQRDIDRLDAIAAGGLGIALEHVECTPLGSAPSPSGATMAALKESLPERDAIEAHGFLVDLHTRTHGWLTT